MFLKNIEKKRIVFYNTKKGENHEISRKRIRQE